MIEMLIVGGVATIGVTVFITGFLTNKIIKRKPKSKQEKDAGDELLENILFIIKNEPERLIRKSDTVESYNILNTDINICLNQFSFAGNVPAGNFWPMIFKDKGGFKVLKMLSDDEITLFNKYIVEVENVKIIDSMFK